MVPGQARDLFTLTLIFADSKKLRHCPGLSFTRLNFVIVHLWNELAQLWLRDGSKPLMQKALRKRQDLRSAQAQVSHYHPSHSQGNGIFVKLEQVPLPFCTHKCLICSPALSGLHLKSPDLESLRFVVALLKTLTGIVACRPTFFELRWAVCLGDIDADRQA